MLKAYKYRIEPTIEQSILIDRHIGSVRFLYNIALETKKTAYASGYNLTRYELQVQLKELKSDLIWLKEVNSQSLQVALMNLDKAYLRFFKGNSSFPVFKKKRNSGSFNIPQKIKLTSNKLIIPKFKKGINIILHRPIKGEIRQATISKTSTGKYFVSILCETYEGINKKEEIKESNTLGIDLGIKNFIVTSDGNKIDSPRFLKKNFIN